MVKSTVYKQFNYKKNFYTTTHVQYHRDDIQAIDI